MYYANIDSSVYFIVFHLKGGDIKLLIYQLLIITSQVNWYAYYNVHTQSVRHVV